MILLAGDGMRDKQIAAIVKVQLQAVAPWRKRFRAGGIEALSKDAPHGGRHRSAPSAAKFSVIIHKTMQTPPPGATHWSMYSMTKAVGVSALKVLQVWREHGLWPHRVKSFKLSNDKHFAKKLEDVVGLYLNPPEHALVLSCPVRRAGNAGWQSDR